MTVQEEHLMAQLGAVWNLFLKLPPGYNSDDTTDFRKAIHDAQRIVMSRDHQRSLDKIPLEGPDYKLVNTILKDSPKGTMDQILSELVEKCPECKGPSRWYWNEQNVQYRLHCGNPRCSWFREPIKAKDPSGITLLKMGKKPTKKPRRRPGGSCSFCQHPTFWFYTGSAEVLLCCYSKCIHSKEPLRTFYTSTSIERPISEQELRDK